VENMIDTIERICRNFEDLSVPVINLWASA
jgi:hypothetical protein